MATFPLITPTYGASKRSQPNVLIAQFGSGYSQRATFGLNQNPKVWNLTWNVSEADADTIEAFLDDRGGAEKFEWTPLDDTTEYKWICREWEKSIPYVGRAIITATFEQVFEA
jgi:phage-related protein